MKQLLERWIELLYKGGSNTKKQVREEMEKFLTTQQTVSSKQPVILYLCDTKKCEKCNERCNHTLDIEHAVNFKHIDDYHIEDDRLNKILQELTKCQDQKD